MLSPGMRNHLISLGGNEEGVLSHGIEKFYLALSDGGSDVASFLVTFEKDFQKLSPGMRQHIKASLARSRR